MSYGMQPPQPPHPPQDSYLRDRIDKMASFVARSGPSVEETTRQKQAGNEQFSFLFEGDPHNPYYRYRVDMEVSFIRGLPPRHHPEVSYTKNEQKMNPNQFDPQIAIHKIQQCKAAIQQSEANLSGQRDSIPLIKEAQLLQAMLEAENCKIARLLQSVHLDVSPLAHMMEELYGRASKDVVVNCKKWILDNCTTDQMREILLMYLLHRVRESQSNDNFRIHILYLINDWAHYCQRKKLDTQTQMLSRYVPKMYAWVSECAQDRMTVTEKLDKLLGTWEGHKYFNDQCFKQLRNPSMIFATEKTTLYGEYGHLAQSIETNLVAMLAGYEAQHKEFCAHQVREIKRFENQIELSERPDGPKSLLAMDIAPPPDYEGRRRSRFDQSAPSRFPREPPENSRFESPQKNRRIPQKDQDEDDIDGVEYNEEDLIPKCEYWDTPAGLMKARIDMHEFTYKAMDPNAIRLEPPMPPSTSLRHAIQMFYAEAPDLPPRDELGWEAGGLAAFFERKMHMKGIQTEKLIADGKDLEEMITNKMSQEDFDEEMREQERARREARQAAIDSRRSRSKSRSSSSSRSSSRGSSRSRRRRRSRSASSDHRRDSSRSWSRSRSRSSSPEAFRRPRSPTPENYIPPMSAFMQNSAPATPLGMENKGAQLMAKMGWKGTGLGANESGIQAPINAGEVREKGEMYKGLGQGTDMYESYRKQLSGGYHARNAKFHEMKEREQRRFN